MKRIAKFLTALALCVVMLTVSACTSYSYSLNKTTATIEVGKTEQLSVTVTPQKDISVSWESSNEAVATVSDSGLVTAQGKGTANVTASVDGKTLTCAVTVTEPEPVPTVYSYSLNKTTATIEVGETEQLSVIVTPQKDISVSWESSNKAVATVSDSGLVTAQDVGTANITASVDGETLTCAVTVTEPDYVAAIGETHYDTFAAALAYANETVGKDEIIVVKAFESGNFTVSDDTVIKGKTKNFTLTDVQFTVPSDKEVTFENLKFSGDSHVYVVNGSSATGSLVIDKCYASVATYTVAESVAANNGHGQFVYFVQTSGYNMNFTLTNSTFICDAELEDDATVAAFGDGCLNKVTITGNTFGSEERPMSRYVFKFMRIKENAEVTISDNTVYGTTTTNKDFYIIDVYNRESGSIAFIKFENNTLNIVINEGRSVYIAYIQSNAHVTDLYMKNNTVNGTACSTCNIASSANVINTHTDY